MTHYHPDHAPDPDHGDAILTGLAFDATAPHDSGLHQHRRGQLMYAVSGVLHITVGAARSILPPHLAAWIPAGLAHRVRAPRPFANRSLYLEPAAFPALPATLRIVAVNPLLREVIVRIAEWPVQALDAGRSHLVSVLVDELLAAPVVPLSLPLPADRRLRRIATHLLREPASAATLEQLAAEAGVSGRTVHRLFLQQTGMGFSAWRQHLIVMEACARLGEGQRVTRVAGDLGYAGDSAFIAMFRKVTGQTPGQFQRQP